VRPGGDRQQRARHSGGEQRHHLREQQVHAEEADIRGVDVLDDEDDRDCADSPRRR
jgi:hypothetical protein